MSSAYYAPTQIEVPRTGISERLPLRRPDGEPLLLQTYGVYPFHDATTKPGHYRVNLGCIDGLDPSAWPVKLIDGRSSSSALTSTP